MAEFVDVATSFPAVVWTAALALSVAYWLTTTLLGGLDLDTDGGLEPGLDPGPDADLGGDGGVDTGLDGGPDADTSLEAHQGSPLDGIIEAVGLGHAPLSVVFTFLSAIGWLVTMLASSALGSPSLPVGLLLLVGSLVVAVPLTGRLARLVQPVFATNPGIDRHHLIGRTCTVRTGRVDEAFGQAEVFDADGASHLIHVRCVVANDLTAGSKALVVSVDDDTFLIDPDLPWADD